MNDRVTQCNHIHELLLAGQRLTSLDSLRLVGCMRLASRVHDLKQKGIPIQSEWTETRDGKRIKEYYL